MTWEREQTLRVCAAVIEAESLDEIIRVLMPAIGELVPYDRASVALLETGSWTLDVREIAPDAAETGANAMRRRVPADPGQPLGQVVVQGRPLLHAPPGRARTPAEPGRLRPVACEIIAPLTARRGVLGALTLSSCTPSGFDERDVDLVALYARLIAGTIANLRNAQAIRDRNIA